MSFTYSLDNVDPNIAMIADVRLIVGDTREDAGPRRDQTNFSDAEILKRLSRYSTASSTDSRVDMAAADLCDMLANDWAPVASWSAGPRSEQVGDISKRWADRAAQLRADAGFSGYINLDFLEPLPTAAALLGD